MTDTLTRTDLRTIETGLRHGWNIPQQLLEKLPSVLGNIVVSGTNREKIAASRVLVAMQRSNNPQVVGHLHQHAHMQAPEPTIGSDLSVDQRRDVLLRRLAQAREDPGGT